MCLAFRECHRCVFGVLCVPRPFEVEAVFPSPYPVSLGAWFSTPHTCARDLRTVPLLRVSAFLPRTSIVAIAGRRAPHLATTRKDTPAATVLSCAATRIHRDDLYRV